MSGYIGSKASVTLVDGYTQAEADAEFVQDPNGVITVDGGNVGIGGTTTTGWANKQVVLDGGANTSVAYVMVNDTTGRAATDGAVMTLSGSDFYLINRESANMIFRTANTERMRIDSSGNVGIGTASLSDATLKVLRSSNSGYGIQAEQSGTLNVPYSAYLRNAGTKAFDFRWYGTTIGSITNSGGTSIAYNTSSDYRLKEDWQPMTGASDRVLALNPVNFAWKADGSRVDGFLAHEVQAVVPECATGTKDAMMDEEYEVTPAVLDDDGSETTAAVMGTRSVPDYQGIDQSKLVPLLTAALQEALTKIDDMETRLAALEGN